MANIYVGSFKDIIKAYYKKQKAFNAKIADNNKRFSPEYAEQENKAVKEQQTEFCRYRIMENKRKSNDVADADKQYH